MTSSTPHASHDGRSRKTFWRGAVVLALATCNGQQQAPGRTEIEPELRRMGVVPSTEVATWRKVVSATAPKGRFLQAAAFDETRGLLVTFGGENRSASGGTPETMQDLWEWSPTQGTWALRTTSGAVPDPRAGATMVFDSARNKMVLFGGRSASGYNYEDLWEWDPTTGDWTERSAAGTHPAARAQQGMVYQKSTGKILLYGGGRSTAPSSDGTSVSMSFGDTWQLDPATATWTAMSPTSSPSVRHDFGLVWDSGRNKAVFFGGMQVDIAGATGVPKEDTWEWDPALGTWTERTLASSKPGQRYGHAMAFDDVGGKVLVFGGWDMQTTKSKNDLWSWDPASGSWTQVLSGSESGVASARSWASMIYDPARSRLDLVAGLVQSTDIYSYGFFGTNDVWEINPATAAFSNRSVGYQGPAARSSHTMAYDPVTGKVFVAGGVDPTTKSASLTDLWEWDGATWAQVETTQNPGQRIDAAMAYDPARQSLILFGGHSWTTGATFDDTWEWNGSTRQWTQLVTKGAPAARWGHALVTDTARKKILMFGASSAMAGEVWEWDGATLSWTNRTPVSSSRVPGSRNYPVVSYDEPRQKMVVYEGSGSLSGPYQSTSAFWEWDVITGGWDLRDPGDNLPKASNVYAVYDSVRRRHVFLTDVVSGSTYQMWELDAKSATWYVRSPANTPGNRSRTAMAYDAGRRVIVVFGGTLSGGTADDTWEYSVSNLANGEGCTVASVAACASGNCVEGVCCESSGCSGACKSCNVSGSEGTCVLAQAGTEVPASCSTGKACDGSGACKSKNGQTCATTGDCASGNCIDGVCCDTACAGTCMACNLAGRVGTCTAYAAGTDPAGECGLGTSPCKSTCDGVGACAFPLDGISCGSCLTCDGAGTCTRPDPACSTGGTGGTGVPGKGGMTGQTGTGGAGGKTGLGGTGGSSLPVSGGIGGTSLSGTGGAIGSGGIPQPTGGAGGAVPASGGQAGSSPGAGGNTGNAGNGGSGAIVGGAGGAARDAGTASGGTGGTASSQIIDSGAPDGAGRGDGGLVASLNRSGCSCDIGRAREATSVRSLWLLLVGSAFVVCRLRKRPRT